MFLFFVINLFLTNTLPSSAAPDQPPIPVLTAIYKDPETQESEYFIGVKSIKIDERTVIFDATLLSFNDKTGIGGTKMLHEKPYTVLHNYIYKPFVAEFTKSSAARNVAAVAPVAPFCACFDTENVEWSEEGVPLNVPVIEMELEVMEQTSPHWRIHGANSMVKVDEDVVCLGFVDGGLRPRSSIVVGGLQLDNLAAFDASKWLSRRRFSYSSLV